MNERASIIDERARALEQARASCWMCRGETIEQQGGIGSLQRVALCARHLQERVRQLMGVRAA